MTPIIHQPKGGMCATCTKRNQDCSGLPFYEMPVIQTLTEGTKIVRCTDHIRDTTKLVGSLGRIVKSNPAEAG